MSPNNWNQNTEPPPPPPKWNKMTINYIFLLINVRLVSVCWLYRPMKAFLLAVGWIFPGKNLLAHRKCFFLCCQKRQHCLYGINRRGVGAVIAIYRNSAFFTEKLREDCTILHTAFDWQAIPGKWLLGRFATRTSLEYIFKIEMSSL